MIKIPERLPLKYQYIYSIAAVILVSVICFLLSGWIGYRVAAFLLLLTVSIIAIVFEIYPVLTAAAVSAFIWDFFFIPPRFTIHVDNAEDSFLLAMYFIIAMINAVLTNRIRKAERITRLKEERANSVNLYNTILDSLSHELRTPLSAIITATDNLQTSRSLTQDQQDRLVREISSAALRLNQQVENLLNISRLESGHIKPRSDWFDVVEFSYGIVKRVEEAHRGRKINISVNPDLPVCKTDKGMLDQIIYNLLNNAAVHTAPGCRIFLTVTCYGNLLTFDVTDQGQGFRDVDPRHVFDKLSRNPGKLTGGSGLGLSIVKGFTEALNGEVQLDPSYKQGARFLVSIPVETSNMNIYNHE